MSKRTVIAVAAAVAAFGAVTASAASLGTLTVKSLGASTDVVASCDTDGVTVAYTTAYGAAAKEYQVSSVNLSGVAAACAGQSVSVTVANGTTVLSSGNVASLSGTSVNVPLTAAVSAKSLDNVAIVIS